MSVYFTAPADWAGYKWNHRNFHVLQLYQLSWCSVGYSYRIRQMYICSAVSTSSNGAINWTWLATGNTWKRGLVGEKSLIWKPKWSSELQNGTWDLTGLDGRPEKPCWLHQTLAPIWAIYMFMAKYWVHNLNILISYILYVLVLISLFSELINTHTHTHTYIYIYIYNLAIERKITKHFAVGFNNLSIFSLIFFGSNLYSGAMATSSRWNVQFLMINSCYCLLTWICLFICI